MTDRQDFEAMLTRAKVRFALDGLETSTCPPDPHAVDFWVLGGIGGSNRGIVTAFFTEAGAFDGFHWSD